MNFKLQELSFTLFAQNLNPAIIHPAILQYAGIIPLNWQLIDHPSYSDRELKLLFDNQVRLIIQPNRIVFAETIGNKNLQEIEVTLLLQNYLKIFSNIDYQGLSIAPSSYISFKSDLAVRQYMSQNLLAANSGQQFAGHKINAVGLKLGYPYQSGDFYLDINQANVELQNSSTPAVWFAGNFNYRLIGDSPAEKYARCQHLLQNWQADVEKFCDLIERQFLTAITSAEISVFPGNSL